MIVYINYKMDKDLYDKTLTLLCEDCKYLKYVDILKNQKFDEFVINAKYLHVQPPIPGVELNDHEFAKNLFNMTYNRIYNEKHNIDPYAYLYESFSGSSNSDDSDESSTEFNWNKYSPNDFNKNK